MKKRRLTKPVVLAVLCLLASSSCSHWQIEASFDRSKDGEQGPSGENSHYDPSINTIVEYASTIPGGTDILFNDDAVRQDPPDPRNPEGYAPANKAANGLGLVTSAGFVGKGRQIGGAVEHLDYLEASEAVAYMHKTSSGLLYGGLGPYIAYGIAGKVKFAGQSENVFTSDGYKRFDAGIHFLGEYRFNNGLSVGAGFDLGIFDKSTDPSDYTSRNRTMMLEVGYSIDKIVKAIKHK